MVYLGQLTKVGTSLTQELSCDNQVAQSVTELLLFLNDLFGIEHINEKIKIFMNFESPIFQYH